MAEKDYLANLRAEPGDRVDHGIKGQKWGIRRSSAQLRSAKKMGPPDHLAKAPSNHVESAPERYDRLTKLAKAGHTNHMSEDDLRFYNNRTDAIAKVNRLHQKDPNWLGDATKKVLLKTTQKSMQAVASAVANKYIDQPLIDKLIKSTK